MLKQSADQERARHHLEALRQAIKASPALSVWGPIQALYGACDDDVALARVLFGALPLANINGPRSQASLELAETMRRLGMTFETTIIENPGSSFPFDLRVRPLYPERS